MAGSTQTILETLFEDIVLNSETTSATTDPTNTLVTTYLNQAIKDIAVSLSPQELLDSSATTSNITVNTNSVTMPTTYLKPTHVYYKDESGKYTEVYPKTIKSLIDGASPSQFFDTEVTGAPRYYSVRGDSLVFDRHFDRTESGAISTFGIKTPTTLSTASPSATTELDSNYDMLIIYKAAIIHFQREEDQSMVQEYTIMARREEVRLRLAMDERSNLPQVRMDPSYFMSRGSSFDNPDIFFSS
jgi:hypothetical protein